MVGDARTRNARPEAACVAHIDGVARIRQETLYRAFFRHGSETEMTLDETGSLLRGFGQDGRGPQAPDRESGRYALAFPGIIGRKIAADQLHDHSVRIAQAQDRFAEFLHRPFGRHMIAQRAFQPETDGSSIYSQRNFTNLSMTDAALEPSSQTRNVTSDPGVPVRSP